MKKPWTPSQFSIAVPHKCSVRKFPWHGSSTTYWHSGISKSFANTIVLGVFVNRPPRRRSSFLTTYDSTMVWRKNMMEMSIAILHDLCHGIVHNTSPGLRLLCGSTWLIKAKMGKTIPLITTWYNTSLVMCNAAKKIMKRQLYGIQALVN